MDIKKKTQTTEQILKSDLVILTELLISYQSYTLCIKIIPGDRLGNKGFIQKSVHLLQNKQNTQHSLMTCHLLYSSLGLSLSPHFINHSPQKSWHTNTIHFQFAFGVIQKPNMAHRKGEVRELSKSPEQSWDVPAQPHNPCVILKSVFWLSSPGWSPHQPCGCHTYGNFVLQCFPFLPNLWVFGKSAALHSLTLPLVPNRNG